MNSTRLFFLGLALCGFSLVSMEQRESIRELKRISADQSFVAQRCEANFTRECAILEEMFRHEKERQLVLGPVKSEESDSEGGSNMSIFARMLRFKLRNRDLIDNQLFGSHLSVEELRVLELAIQELIKDMSCERAEEELNYIRKVFQ